MRNCRGARRRTGSTPLDGMMQHRYRLFRVPFNATESPMPLPATDAHPHNEFAPGSFLRIEPDAAMSADESNPIGRSGKCMEPLFPPPEVDQTIITRLDEWERFAALAVRIDPPAQAAPDSALDAKLSDCLESLARRNGAVWFAWDTGLYGCAVPDMDPGGAVTLAQSIQSELAEHRVETVSIGISGFPLLDFDPAAVLQNACKALDHAAFSGPHSIVPFDAVSLNISGDHYYQSGYYDAAIAEYRAALCLDAVNVNVLNSLGVCLAQQADLIEARALFEEAMRIDPDESMAVYNLGVLHLIEKDKAGALTRFRQAFALDNRTFDIPFRIGKLLCEDKAYAEALNFLQTAVALKEASAPAHSLMGRCLACLGRSEEALAAYKKAIKFNPNDAAALSALGSLYDARGENPDICLTFCRQSVALAPDNGLFRLRLARLYHKHNLLEQALDEYETAKALGCNAHQQIAEIQELLNAAEDDKQYCA
jgi:tetratricopeptide (TPR) repeat protein